MTRHRVGRPAKGTIWKWPGFWALNETPAMTEAQPFLTPNKLGLLKQMLAIVAHWHANKGTTTEFIDAVNEVVGVAEKMRELKKEGNVAWNVQAGRFNRRIEEELHGDLMRDALSKL